MGNEKSLAHTCQRQDYWPFCLISLALARMPGVDKPVRARQQVIAGIGAQALNQSCSDSEVYTDLTMGIRGGDCMESTPCLV